MWRSPAAVTEQEEGRRLARGSRSHWSTAFLDKKSDCACRGSVWPWRGGHVGTARPLRQHKVGHRWSRLPGWSFFDILQPMREKPMGEGWRRAGEAEEWEKKWERGGGRRAEERGDCEGMKTGGQTESWKGERWRPAVVWSDRITAWRRRGWAEGGNFSQYFSRSLFFVPLFSPPPVSLDYLLVVWIFSRLFTVIVVLFRAQV